MFLHLTGIAGAADQDHLLGEVDGDHRIGTAAVTRRIGAEARQGDDRKFGNEVFKLARLGADQEGADELVVPGELVDDAHADARSEEHTSELQSLMRISYAGICLKKK